MHNRNSLGRAVGALGVALACGGCASPVIQSKPALADATGLFYALPKGQVLLEASRQRVTEDKVAKAQQTAAAAAAAQAAAAKALGEAKALQKDAQAVAAAAGQSVKAELERQRDVADAVVRARTVQLEQASAAAAAAQQEAVRLAAAKGGMKHAASLKTLAPAPDPTERYIAQLSGHAWRDDNIKLVTENGLLSGSTSEATGQAGAVLVNLFSAIAAGAPGAVPSVGLMSLPKLLATPPAQECKEFVFSRVFDPTDAAEVDAAAAALAQASGMSWQLTVTPAPQRPAGASSTEAPKPRSADGLVYRAPVPVSVHVEARSAGGCTVDEPTAATLHTAVPDSRMRLVMPFDAGAFTKTKHAMVFKNGMPVEMSIDQPSQAAAVARLPVEILKAMVEVPASILKLRVDHDNQGAALIEAQSKQVQAQIDLLKAQQALQDAKKDAQKGDAAAP